MREDGEVEKRLSKDTASLAYRQLYYSFPEIPSHQPG
jgi:hypothetical protein